MGVEREVQITWIVYKGMDTLTPCGAFMLQAKRQVMLYMKRPK
jgi:hypothetical protein